MTGNDTQGFPQTLLGESIRKVLAAAVSEHDWVKVQFITNDPNSLQITCDGAIADFAILPVPRGTEPGA